MVKSAEQLDLDRLTERKKWKLAFVKALSYLRRKHGIPMKKE